ncbi:MAG: AI-2E family transporter [Proteobacteria bacterium]|nr:AI-2E family transporter [Pseudomonadota bacterium]MBU1387920.1 AI-2E family transporter [Pseudomonadota bacterium]MBU1541983.1 AI-2E family transporter [Pseudomonadota bacterium]MBU2481347.1 AI-2E family transporter [Pseudomonadota bacterium]
MEQNISQRAVFVFFIALFCSAILLAGKLIAPFFATIILGVVATGVFRPVFSFFSKKLTPKIASVLTCVLIFIVVLIPVIFFVGVISKEAFNLYVMARDAVFSNQIKTLLASTQALDRLNDLILRAGIEKVITWDELFNPVSELGKFVGFSLFEQARFITSNIFNIGLYFCLILIVVFYMFMDGDKFIKYMYDLSPLPDEHDEKLFRKFMNMAGAVLIGNGLGGLIQGVAGGFLFLFLGFNSPFLWGVIMGFLAFLPIVGIGIILIPTAIILLLKSNFAAGIFVIVFYALLSWGVEYIFKPKVVGNRVSMHPLIVFFAIIGGLKAYGILGIIYGPLIATFFLTLADIYFSSFQFMVEPGKVLKEK